MLLDIKLLVVLEIKPKQLVLLDIKQFSAARQKLLVVLDIKQCSALEVLLDIKQLVLIESK